MRVAGVIFNDDSRVLVVRKRDAAKFTLPGGKLEDGETALEAAIREIREELGLDLEPADLEELGSVEGFAANEVGEPIRSTIFTCRYVGASSAHGEIEQMRWISTTMLPEDPGAGDISPLLISKILPLYRAISQTDGDNP